MKKVFLSVLFCLIINSLRGENFRFALLTDIHVSGDPLAHYPLQVVK